MFSLIIVVMTAMRVMQSNIDRQLSSLGTDTFIIRKWPTTYFGFSGDLEKIWLAQRNITLAQGKKLEDKTDLPLSVGVETAFWSGRRSAPVTKPARPPCGLYGETPTAAFSAHGWDLAEGRIFMDADVDSARRICVLASGLATNIFPNSSPLNRLAKR